MRRATTLLLPLLFAAPLAFLVLGSLRAPGAAAPIGAELLPAPSLGSFERAFDLQPLARQLRNSLTVALIAVPLTVVVSSLAGFGMALAAPRTRRALVGLSLALLVVPLSALWVPRFVLFSELDLVDTYVPLIAPALLGTSPFYILLFFWSFRRIPPDVLDAGRLGGLGPFRLWWRIASPLVRPTTFAVAALSFAFHWGNFIDPLLYLFDPDRLTLPVGLRSLAELGPTDFGTVLAGALVATLPAALAFAMAGDRFLAGACGAGWLGR